MILNMRNAACLAAGVAMACLAPVSGVDAKDFNVLYSFCSQANCSDGLWPYAGLIADAGGNLYGTTGAGGAVCRFYGCGTVFKLAPDGTETVLHQFTAQYDGSGPYGGLVMDKRGNLYGTTATGGSTGCGGIDYGCGTIFRISTKSKEKVVYAFGGDSDGAYPLARLVADKQGNLYGTTSDGGGGTQCTVQFGGCGTVFKVTPAGVESKLYSFTGGTDGANPQAALIVDKSGNLFGTTAAGGNASACNQGVSPGCGVVFEITAGGKEKTLYTFQGGNDGWSPVADLVEDKAGNLYGTTQAGGSTSACSGVGCGIVFEIAPDGTETILHAFTGGDDGAHPAGGLVLDGKGRLYGTTASGGSADDGTVFMLEPGSKFKVLNTFTGGTNGYAPVADLVMVQGELYGTTEFSNGTVFELAK